MDISHFDWDRKRILYCRRSKSTALFYFECSSLCWPIVKWIQVRKIKFDEEESHLIHIIMTQLPDAMCLIYAKMPTDWRPRITSWECYLPHYLGFWTEPWRKTQINRLILFIFFFLQGPEGCVDKPFLWTEGRVSLRAALDKSAYVHGEPISVSIDVKNDSRKIVRKIRVRHSYRNNSHKILCASLIFNNNEKHTRKKIKQKRIVNIEWNKN